MYAKDRASMDAVAEATMAVASHFAAIDDIDVAIEASLRTIGELTGAGRAYLFEFRPGGDIVDNTNEWCAPGVQPQKEQLQALSTSLFPWWMERVMARQVIHIENVDALGDEAAAERELLQAQQIRSLLSLPAEAAGEVVGFVGLDNVSTTGAWPQDCFDVLRIVARILGQAILRRRAGAHRKALERRLQRTERLDSLGRLAGGIAHDLNNVLAIVLSYAALMREDLPGDSPLCADLAEIERAALRGRRLIEQILTFSRVPQQVGHTVDLAAAVGAVRPLLERGLGEDVRLFVHVQPDLPRVRAGAGEIEQVLAHLVANAREAMSDGGIVAIDVARSVPPDDATGEATAWVRIDVRDSGEGMDATVLSSAFDPFFTTRDRTRHEGLGLTTVHAVVTRAGGHVRLTSQPGRGTTASVWLPVPSEPTEADAPARPTRPRRRATVLLVEDEDALRTVLRRALEQRGHDVIEAGHPGVALLAARRHRDDVDIVVTDVVMPEMSGVELAAQLRDVIPDVPVLFMSGYPDETLARHRIDPLRVALLFKPFTPETLQERIEALLDR